MFFLTSIVGIKPIIKYEGVDAITGFGLQVAHLTPAALKRLGQKRIKAPSQKLQWKLPCSIISFCFSFAFHNFPRSFIYQDAVLQAYTVAWLGRK
jgi:hypothetical protein